MEMDYHKASAFSFLEEHAEQAKKDVLAKIQKYFDAHPTIAKVKFSKPILVEFSNVKYAEIWAVTENAVDGKNGSYFSSLEDLPVEYLLQILKNLWEWDYDNAK